MKIIAIVFAVLITVLGGNAIAVPPGQATAAAGANNPTGSVAAPGQVDVPTLQVAVTADAIENQFLNSITITDANAGADPTPIDAVHLWQDTDGSGTVTTGDVLLNGDQVFTAGVNTLKLLATAAVSTVPKSGTMNYLVTYDFAAIPTASRMRSIIDRAKGWAKALIAGPFMLAGCGGSASTTSTLTGLPDGFKYTDTDGNTITSANSGDIVQVRTNEGLKILEFTMGSTAVAFSDTLLGRNAIGTLVALNPGTSTSTSLGKAATGLPDDITVFVPCSSGNDLVQICPNETTIPDGAAGCQGEIQLTTVEPTLGGYTWTNTERTSDDDCEIEGATDLFNTFYGEGFTAQSFQNSIAQGADVVLTGEDSTATISPPTLNMQGGVVILVTD